MIFLEFLHRTNLKADAVEDKAGKQTYGIGMFYSSIVQKAIRSISFLAISIIDIEAENSYLLACWQVMPIIKSSKPDSKKENPKSHKAKGRPKGSKNKVKIESTANSYQSLKTPLTLLDLTMNQLSIFFPTLQCFHLVLDGRVGGPILRSWRLPVACFE